MKKWETVEDIIADLRADVEAARAARLKPKPTVEQRTEARFNPDNKPTEAVIDEASIHNAALQERLRKEREGALAEQERAARQAQLDRWWQSALDAKAEAEAYVEVGGFRERRRPTCHRGRNDPDWGL
jgi:hypothetical protein